MIDLFHPKWAHHQYLNICMLSMSSLRCYPRKVFVITVFLDISVKIILKDGLSFNYLYERMWKIITKPLMFIPTHYTTGLTPQLKTRWINLLFHIRAPFFFLEERNLCIVFIAHFNELYKQLKGIEPMLLFITVSPLIISRCS